MKILYVGSTEGRSSALHYFTSMVRLGHDVLPFSPRYFEARNLVEKVAVRLRHGPTPQAIERYHRELVAICRANAFDVVFVMSENFLGHRTLEEIRDGVPRPPLFVFHSHDNVFSPGICKPADFDRTLAAYDVAFTTKSQNVARYQALGQRNAFYVPSAYEPLVHRPVPESESRLPGGFEVTFVGTYDHSRGPWLEAAGWNRLHVWGDHWRKFPDFARHQAHITPHAIFYFELADILSRSRVALGLLREEAEDRHTQRTFEIPACGALQLAPRNDEILSFFEEDKEIVCFETPDELREKIDRCLKDDDWARRIARRGYERVLRDRHSYQDRVAHMLWQVTNLGAGTTRALSAKIGR